MAEEKKEEKKAEPKKEFKIEVPKDKVATLKSYETVLHPLITEKSIGMIESENIPTSSLMVTRGDSAADSRSSTCGTKYAPKPTSYSCRLNRQATVAPGECTGTLNSRLLRREILSSDSAVLR